MMTLETLVGLSFWDDTTERMKDTANHEAGHAAFSWHLAKNRNLRDPPFRRIRIEHSINDNGCIEGDVNWDEGKYPDSVSKAAVILAGVYCGELLGAETPKPFTGREWKEFLAEMSSKPEGMVDFRKLAALENGDYDKVACQALQLLQNKSSKMAINLAKKISNLLMECNTVDITDPILRGYLNQYEKERSETVQS